MIFLYRAKKQKIRETVLHKIKNLPDDEKIYIEDLLYKHLFNSLLWKEAKVIGITSSTSIEWNTGPIIERAWQDNKIVALPKTIPHKSLLKFYQVESFNELIVGYADILEPIHNESNYIAKENIDLLIVPGVVFDLFGYRIGFGGGYYDRFLADFPNRTVSLVSRIQLVEQLPVEKHDKRVDYLICEDGLRRVSEV